MGDNDDYIRDIFAIQLSLNDFDILWCTQYDVNNIHAT